MSQYLKVVSSQYKHLPGRDDEFITPRVITNASMMKNEPFSFQVLYTCPETPLPLAVSVGIDSELPISAYRVDYVPIMNTMNLHNDPTGFESNLPGIYPDILMPRPANPETYGLFTVGGDYPNFEKVETNLLNATHHDYQSVWFTVNNDSDTLKAGVYTLNIVMKTLKDNTVLDEEKLEIEIIDAELPEHTTYYTNWIHMDCICDMFGVELYSDEFYEVFDKHVINMVRHRQNVILLPAFTPPLDTQKGMERMNVQLVKIQKTESGWKFNFDEMRRYVRHALKCGISYFEHCHIFSQWGAVAAPNIYNDKGELIFNCQTDASSDEYVEFIRAYLIEFLKFAKDEGIEDKMLFHISDEPNINHMESYRKAHDNVADILDGKIIADAMCHLEYYSEGLVDQPIAYMMHADKFDNNCPTFWLYYTGYPHPSITNRMIPNTAARTRVVGLQLYRYKALGFLDWAYNFYYDRLSAGFFDPKCSPNGYKMYPGISYLAYPIVQKGVKDIVPSIREKLMCEAFDDLRALKLLESRIGRDAVISICEEHVGTLNKETNPDKDSLYTLREAINKKIKETN